MVRRDRSELIKVLANSLNITFVIFTIGDFLKFKLGNQPPLILERLLFYIKN